MKPFAIAGFGQQLLRRGGIVRIVLDRFVVRPHRRRDRVRRRDACAQEHGVDDGLLVDRHVDGLAHTHVVERFLRDVVGEVADVEARLLEHDDVLVLADRVEVGRVGVRHHMAFTLLQLGPAHRGVRRDREDEVVDLRLAAPELRERLVADDRVLDVAVQVERAGADRFLVDLLGSSRLEHRIGVLLRLHAGIFHREIRQERRLGLLERDPDRVVVDLLHRLQQLGHAHVVEVRVVRARDLEIGIGFLPLALDREDHVVRIEVARRLEGAMVVPLHALAQVERVDLAVRGDFPLLGEAGHDRGAAALEVDDAAVDLAVGVERRAGGIDGGIEVLGAALGAVHEGLGREVGGGEQRGKASAATRARGRRDASGWVGTSSCGCLLWMTLRRCAAGTGATGRHYGLVRGTGGWTGSRNCSAMWQATIRSPSARGTGRSVRQRSNA